MSLRKTTPLQLTIAHRTLLMSGVFLAILLMAFYQVQINFSRIVSQVNSATANTQAQTEAVIKQNRLVSEQDRQVFLQSITLEAYAAYSSYINWRYDAVLTLDSRSLAEANHSEQKLRQKLTEISELEPELGEATEVVEVYLADFNRTIDAAISLLKEEAPKGRVQGKVGESQSHRQAMNATFDAILEQTANAVKKASAGVREAGGAVDAAADKLKASGEETTDIVSHLNQQLWWIMGIAALVSVVAGVLIARSISRPINRLVTVIAEIEATSDLTRRINYQGHDEIGKISTAFNAMLEKIHRIIQSVASATMQLSQSAEEGTRVSESSLNNAIHLQQESELIATAANEMAATVKHINDSTTQAVEETHAAQQACQQGKNIIGGTTEAIAVLAEDIKQGSETVAQMAINSQEIGSVLDVIRGIAEQTNLLALNAAIEAARAGEQGRGFAVVADEVRTLAQKTGASTDEIQRMIELLQNSAANAVRQIDSSRDKAQQTLTQAQGTTQSISSITDAFRKINATSEQISQATEEQTNAAESIDRSIIKMNHLAVESAEAARQNAITSEHLARLVDELNEQIRRFHF
ncbi:MAG: methyl-accepting chemotaxis protein [Hahellaceae bacterium]|nr:methyl-accepting chemotaxis protein [Hahellaceae bacterium]MCP5168788.1 methyl-accepting chemotaxis protein [Hahellaceae bacterium]